MVEKDLGPARVSAFSDGVIAIIITIMVLELHVPRSADPHLLLALWPTLASYALSYAFVAIYWMNHHHLFSMVRRVDTALLWSNILLLFFLSLMPFLTAYVGETHMASFPVFCYATNMLVCGVCFMALAALIARNHFCGDAEAELLYRASLKKNLIAIALYAVAIACSYSRPMFSMTLILAVAVMYIVPGAGVQRAIRNRTGLGG